MKRTINERKALKRIFIFGVINVLSLVGYATAIKIDSLILGALMIFPYILSLFLSIYNGYSLGWEYKRLQLEDAQDIRGEKK